MNPGTIFAFLLIIMAVAIGLLMGNTDVSSASLAAEELRMGTPGPATSAVIFNQLAGFTVGILITGLVGGVSGLVFIWLRDWYEERKKSKPGGEWESGPNANFRRRGVQQSQGLSKDEIFQLALLNAVTQGQAQRYLPQISEPVEPDSKAEF
jgi:hypothetical protein